MGGDEVAAALLVWRNPPEREAYARLLNAGRTGSLK
jgi:hypothetical protein